jgi:hypothetical protein
MQRHTVHGRTRWRGKIAGGVSDIIGPDRSPSASPAKGIAQVIGAYNCGTPGIQTAFSTIQALPTKPDYGANQKFHLVPRRAT